MMTTNDIVCLSPAKKRKGKKEEVNLLNYTMTLRDRVAKHRKEYSVSPSFSLLFWCQSGILEIVEMA